MPSPSPFQEGSPCRAAAISSGDRRGGRGIASSSTLERLRPRGPRRAEHVVGREEVLFSAVDAALGLGAARPAPGASVLTGGDGAGAGGAADRREAEVDERVDRHLVPG